MESSCIIHYHGTSAGKISHPISRSLICFNKFAAKRLVFIHNIDFDGLKVKKSCLCQATILFAWFPTVYCRQFLCTRWIFNYINSRFDCHEFIAAFYSVDWNVNKGICTLSDPLYSLILRPLTNLLLSTFSLWKINRIVMENCTFL